MPRVDLPDPHGHRRAPPGRPMPAPSPSPSGAPSAPSASPVPSTPAAPLHPTPKTPGRRLTFVTGNAGKVRELTALLAPLRIEVVADARGYPEVQAATLREVTEAGAKHLLAAGLVPPFVLEDSGLFVAALRGFPGVFSRHAFDTIGSAGILRLVQDLELEMRSAAFQTDLAYVDGAGKVHHFEGTCKGRIADRAAGSNGFGFDPIFVPQGHLATFGEMDPAVKGAISHRGKAVMGFARHLTEAANP